MKLLSFYVSKALVRHQVHFKTSGGRLNIKMAYQYMDPHVKDKTVSRLGKTVFILRRGPDVCIWLR